MKLKLFILIFVSGLFSSCISPSDKKIEQTIEENVSIEMKEYFSEYKPVISETIPEVHIKSSSGNNDFIFKPVSAAVSEMKKSWGGYFGEPAPFYEDCEITVYENNKISLEDLTGKVKVRGNWTSNYPKKPLAIKFDKETSILGMHNGKQFKNWVLLASYKDWSFLRDTVAYYMGHMISPLYTSDFRYVKVFSNDEYIGLYILAEKQEVNIDKINLTKSSPDYTGNDIGYLLEMDTYYKNSLYNFEIDYISDLKDYNNNSVKHFMNGYSVKSDIQDSSQALFINNYMNRLWKLCYEAVYNNNYLEFNDDFTELIPSEAKTCYECISNVIDLESLAQTYLLHEICCDADIAWSSFYMDIDFGKNGNKKLKFQAPWDFDSALGNKNFCADSKGIYAGSSYWDVNHQTRGWGNPWFIIFINCNWFRELVSQKWTMVRNQEFENKVVEFIDNVSFQYEDEFIENYKLWKNAGKPQTLGELCSGAAKCKNQKQAADYLKNWLLKRFASIDEYWLKK
ncbi:MAG: CotH kinase family protein [Treponema sp.]|nr:CotH kinase family protein [Treponema sp.]